MIDLTVSGVIYIRHADDGMDVRPLYKLPIKKRKREKKRNIALLVIVGSSCRAINSCQIEGYDYYAQVWLPAICRGYW